MADVNDAQTGKTFRPYPSACATLLRFHYSCAAEYWLSSFLESQKESEIASQDVVTNGHPETNGDVVGDEEDAGQEDGKC